MSGYSLFDVKKSDARRVVDGISGLDFVGHKLYAEIADPEKDYSRASSRRKKGDDSHEEFAKGKSRGKGKGKGRENSEKKVHGNYDKFINKDRKSRKR